MTSLINTVGGYGLVDVAKNDTSNRIKATWATAAGVGVGYTAASLISNPNGQVATTVTKGANKTLEALNKCIDTIKGTDAYKTVAKTTKALLTKVKGTDAYKTAAGYVSKAASKITSNSAFKKIVSTVKNSSVGKWVAANPKLAVGIAAATALIGWIAGSKSKEA